MSAHHRSLNLTRTTAPGARWCCDRAGHDVVLVWQLARGNTVVEEYGCGGISANQARLRWVVPSGAATSFRQAGVVLLPERSAAIDAGRAAGVWPVLGSAFVQVLVPRPRVRMQSAGGHGVQGCSVDGAVAITRPCARASGCRCAVRVCTSVSVRALLWEGGRA